MTGDLFADIAPAKAFDGASYEAKHDYVRLKGQMLKVFDLMSDGQWRTLAEVNKTIRGSEAAISARLRDLRKKRYGQHIVERKRMFDGLFQYRMVMR